MANICDTTYKVTGSRKALTNLWNTLQTMRVNEKNIWLGDLASHYGIDYKAKKISVRGDIYWAELDEEQWVLSFDTESAWCACIEFFEELNHVLGDELSISFREIETGCQVFYVHDEGGFFTEECCVSCYGSQFEENGELVRDSIEEEIDEWCKIMNIDRNCRSQEEMLDFINDYEYDDEDTYFYIYPFVFE